MEEGGGKGRRKKKRGSRKESERNHCIGARMHAQSCPTLCNPMDRSPPGSSVHETLQARILECVAVPSCRGSSRPGDWTHISYTSYISATALVLPEILEARRLCGIPFTDHWGKRAATQPKFHLNVRMIDIYECVQIHKFVTQAPYLGDRFRVNTTKQRNNRNRDLITRQGRRRERKFGE